MDGRRGKKLARLAWLITRHRDAVEYELIRHGHRLREVGSPALSWRDVWVIVTSIAPGSRLARELDPRGAWTTTDYLLAAAVDALHMQLWAQSKDGQKNRNRPKPIERPGTPTHRFSDIDARPVEELKQLLSRPRR